MMGLRSRLERLIRSKWGVLFVVGPYIAVVILAAVFVDRIGSERDARVSQVEAQQRQDCLDRRDGRTVLRKVVEEATEPGQPVDFAAVPGFDQLEPTMQTYLQNLANALNSSDPDQQPLRARLLGLIPEIDCPAPGG